MRPRSLLFIIGLLVLILGALPLLRQIPAVEEIVKDMPAAGSIIYQLLLVLIGIIAVSYSLRRKRIPREIRKELQG